jgi:tetratricopeptide (TPR) repeat protein
MGCYKASKNWIIRHLRQRAGIVLLSLFLAAGYSYAETKPAHQQPSLSPVEQLILENRLDEAIRQLEQTMADHPSSEGYRLLGLAYQKKSRQLSAESITAYEKAISWSEASVEARLNLGDIYFQQGRYEKAIEVLSPLADKPGVPPVALHKLALAYLNADQLNQSLNTWERLAQLQPEDEEVMFYQGLIKEKKERYEEAQEHYMSLISSKPKSTWAYKAQKQLEGIEAYGGAQTLAGVEDNEIRQIIEQAPGENEYPDAGAIILLNEIIYTIHKNHTMTTKIHRLIKILNERGKDFGEVKLDYDSSYQTVKVDFARTIKQDGRIVNVGKKSMRDLTPWAGFPLYSNAKVKVISMPEVVAGSIIEYTATIESAEMINQDDFQFTLGLRSYEPQLLQRIILDVPAEQPLKIHYVRLKDISPLIEHKAGRRVYTWEIKNIPEIITEPMMPPWADISPFIMVSSFENWEEIGTWFQKLSRDQFQTDDAIRQKIAQLISDAPTKEEKARRIFHFVATEIRYVGLEYGVSGYKPHQAVEIFKNKYGDCKDQSTLLVAMLREAGVSAQLALLSTSDNGQVETDIPMIQFDHCIAVAKLEQGLIWLDPTCDTCSFGEVPADDQKRQALVMFSEGARFQTTPLIDPARNKMLKQVKLNILADGSVQGTSKLITSGTYSISYRGFKYSKPIKRRHILQSLINDMYPGGKLLDYSITGLENMDQPVTISMQYSGPSYLKSAGDLRLFQLPGIGSSASSVSREERNYPLQFSTTSWTEVHTTIKLPPKYKVRYLPEEIKLELPYVSYWSRYESRDGEIHYFEQSIIKKIEIAVADYQQYKQYREKIARESDKQIILEEIK